MNVMTSHMISVIHCEVLHMALRYARVLMGYARVWESFARVWLDYARVRASYGAIYWSYAHFGTFDLSQNHKKTDTSIRDACHFHPFASTAVLILD